MQKYIHISFEYSVVFQICLDDISNYADKWQLMLSPYSKCSVYFVQARNQDFVLGECVLFELDLAIVVVLSSLIEIIG